MHTIYLSLLSAHLFVPTHSNPPHTSPKTPIIPIHRSNINPNPPSSPPIFKRGPPSKPGDPPLPFPSGGPLFTPSISLSHDTQPSSSGPFTSINLPSGWTLYPPSSASAIIPVQLAAAHLEAFYTALIATCAHNFWSPNPDTPLLNNALRAGPFMLTVIGAAGGSSSGHAGGGGGTGVPWGILALIAQGMLERARRGWTSTFDGALTSPEDAQYRVLLTVDGQELGNSGPQLPAGGHGAGEGLECSETLEGEEWDMESQGETEGYEESERRRKGKKVCRRPESPSPPSSSPSGRRA
ncbi:MAG: hypothetical protein Q9166_007226 [cf. Caloplaca sp. 2 TL-2023]